MMWTVTKVVIAVALVVFGFQPIIEDMAGALRAKSLAAGNFEPPQLTPSSIMHDSASKGRDYSAVKPNNADVSKITSLVALPIGAGGVVGRSYFNATADLAIKISGIAVFLSLVLRGCKIRKQP